MSVTVKLYKMTTSKNRLNKGSYLSTALSYTGTLREETDVLNPSILIEDTSVNHDEILKQNYAYISEFKRYYFIERISVVNETLLRINLRVDVLYSFMSDIELQTGFFERLNDSLYVKEILDERVPITGRESVHISTGTPTSANNIVNATIKWNGTGLAHPKAQVLIQTFSSGGGTTPHTITTHYGDSSVSGEKFPRYIYGTGIENNNFYLATTSTLSALQTACVKNDVPASYIKNILILPVEDAYPIFGLTFNALTLTSLYLGGTSAGNDWWSLDVPNSAWIQGNFGSNVVTSLGEGLIPPIIVFDGTFTTPYHNPTINPIIETEYIEPYAKYELYIPLLGYVTLPKSKILDQRIIVFYAVDVDTGMADAYVINQESVIFAGTCQFAQKVSLNTSNNYENTITKQNAENNKMLSLISSAISIGTGIITKNPLGIIGGVMAGAKSLTDFNNTMNTLIERGQTSFGTQQTGLYGRWDVHLRITHKNLTDDAIFYWNFTNKNGYVYKKTSLIQTHLNKGYAEIYDIQYAPVNQSYITSGEIDEIEKLCANGVII